MLKAVSDQDDRFIRQPRPQIFLDRSLGFGIEMAGRLVENQDVGAGEGVPVADRQPLPLAAGQVGPPFTDNCFKSVRQ